LGRGTSRSVPPRPPISNAPCEVSGRKTTLHSVHENVERGKCEQREQVDVSRPPTITMASGLSISVPCSLSTNKGSRPRIAVEAVMILGRTLPMLASLTASSRDLPSINRDPRLSYQERRSEERLPLGGHRRAHQCRKRESESTDTERKHNKRSAQTWHNKWQIADVPAPSGWSLHIVPNRPIARCYCFSQR
jgi:hypothetical protein